MSAQPVDPQPRLQLDGEDAVIIPLAKLQRLEAIERHASAEVIAEAEAEEAEITGVLSEYRQWVAGGRRGGASQDEMEQAFADSLRQ